METMKMGILGSGGIAHTMANTVKEMKDVELYAVGSRTLENAEKFAAEFGISKAYGSYEELAADPEVDLVYVATPHSHHYPHVKLLLEHGKHVLCEKPVCSNREELDILIKAAKEQGVVFMEAMKNVHSPGFHAMMDNLHKIGTVRRATIQYCQYSSRYDTFNPKLSNGALMDIGSYCIHFLASLFGKPEKILADSLFLENGVDGAGSVIASYGDKQAEIIYSKITDSKLPTQIQGENGCMIIEQCPIIKKITIYYRNGETEELQFDKRDNPMIYETKDFIRLIKEHKVDHQFLRASEIEMDITDEVRRQTGIVFPADKIREQ